MTLQSALLIKNFCTMMSLHDVYFFRFISLSTLLLCSPIIFQTKKQYLCLVISLVMNLYFPSHLKACSAHCIHAVHFIKLWQTRMILAIGVSWGHAGSLLVFLTMPKINHELHMIKQYPSTHRSPLAEIH